MYVHIHIHYLIYMYLQIGGIEPKPRRDILMTDFEVVDTVEFPANGSDCTPAHKYRDFTFKTYSPEAFRSAVVTVYCMFLLGGPQGGH